MSKLRTRLEPLGSSRPTFPAAGVAYAPDATTAWIALHTRDAASGCVAWLARRSHVIVLVMAAGWAGEFAWLALQRHLAGGSHAEDLGFTEQVLSNFLRGQWFRMSIYQGATWNTEIDLGRIARPDSLLAFHFEPMLLLLVPLYAVGGMSLLLVVQAVAVAAGAVPAYRLGRYGADSTAAGLAVAAAYLLSPLGQWAVLDDFHTSTLAAPLLVLAVERLVVKQSPRQALAAFALAVIAREDVGLAVAALGVVLFLRGSFPSPRLPKNSRQESSPRPELSHTDRMKQSTPSMSPPANRDISARELSAARGDDRRMGMALFGLGLGASILATLVIRSYNGGLPFDARYAETLGRGFGASLAALERPIVIGYLQTLALSGAWLGLLAPLALVPALPSLLLNALSTSPWMAAGKAHYSALVLPFIVLGAAAGLRHVRTKTRLVHILSAGLVLGSALGYVRDGSGPLGGNYAPATLTAHALSAEHLAQVLPADAAVSASSALVPRLSRRAHMYVFPAMLDADYVYVDLQASPSPTSAGDVFMRIQALLAAGGWQVQNADDGLLLLHRAPDAPPTTLAPILTDSAHTDNTDAIFTEPTRAYDAGRVSLVSAVLVPGPDGAVDVDGPRWILRTTWRAEQPLANGTRLDFWVSLRDGPPVHTWDIAPLWWNPPEQWTPGQPVTIDLPDVPVRQFVSWQATFSEP